MLAAQDLLAQLSGIGVEIEAHGDRLRYRPRSAMTPDLLAAVKSCKPELLEILATNSLLPEGLGGSGSRSTGAASVSRANCTTGSNKVDREFDRFFSVAIPTPDGNGLYDPSVPGAAQVCSLHGYKPEHPVDGVPSGWSLDGWRKYLLDLATSCEPLHPEKAAEYRCKAEVLEGVA